MCVRDNSGGGGGTSGGDGGGSGGGDSGGDSGVGDCGGGEGGSRRLSHTPIHELTRRSSDAFRSSRWPIMVLVQPPLWALLHTLPPAVAAAAAAANRLVSLGESIMAGSIPFPFSHPSKPPKEMCDTKH